jgi:hypothetical protein
MMRILTVLSLAMAIQWIDHGSHRVGWRFQIERDATRSYAPAEGDRSGPGPRPIAITTWYPAAASGGSPAVFRDFARLGAFASYVSPPATAETDTVSQAIKDTSPAALEGPANAFQNAPIAAGRFPLVLFAHSTPLGQSALSEYLASSGFVVAGLMSRGATAGAYRLSVEDVQAMADDIELAYRRLSALPNVDASRVAVVGMSNGALGAIGAANKLSVVRAVVSLDGTIGERAAGRVLPMLAGANGPASNPNLLHLYAPVNEYLDFSELRKRSGSCFTVRIPTVRHADFLSYALLQPPAAGDASRVRPDDKFRAMARLTRMFIESSFAERAGAAMPELVALERELGLEVASCGRKAF